MKHFEFEHRRAGSKSRSRPSARLGGLWVKTALVGAVLLAPIAVSEAATVDGLSVTFNTLPTSVITSGLDESSLSPGANYVGYLSNGSYSYHYYGETNPFEYENGVYRDSSVPQFDGVYNGSAFYNYSAPLSTLSILWGSVDPDNALTFYSPLGTVTGSISGADLITAIEAAGLPSSEISGSPSHQPTVDITVAAPAGSTIAGAYGSPSLTFEYSNLVGAVSAAPEPSTWAVLVMGVFGVGAVARRRSSRAVVSPAA